MGDENLPEVVQEIGGGDLAITRDPDLVLAEAQRAARALKSVIEGKAKKVIFNGEQYLEFEDWQTVGKFYGVTVKAIETHYVEYGEVRGFEAKAVAMLVKTGMEISQAEALCLNDEPNWGTRTKYEWFYVKKSGGTSAEDPGPDELIWEGGKPKKVRVKVGEEPVPLFQLKSMAQTRACAKAFRNVLAWVVVLAGYRPTPAEEMTGTERGSGDEDRKVAAVKCPTCHKENTIIKGKPEYGGGWLCYSKKGGCGAKFDYDPANPPSSKVAEPQAKEGAKEKIQFPSKIHEELYSRVEFLCSGDPVKMTEATKTLTSWSDARKNFHEGMGNILLLSNKQAEEALIRFEKEFGQMAL